MYMHINTEHGNSLDNGATHTKLNIQELIIHVAEYLIHTNMGPRDILDGLIIEGVVYSYILISGVFYLQSQDQAQDVYWFSLHSNHKSIQCYCLHGIP